MDLKLKCLSKTSIIIFLVFLFGFLFFSISYAQSDDDKLKELNDKIAEYTTKIDEAKGKQKTLASAITLITNQMNLTIAQIAKAEEQVRVLETEIDELSKKIILLDKDLDETVNIMNVRVEETYKRMHMPSIYLLLVSNKFSNFFSNLNYIKTVQAHDKEVLYAMEQARLNYDLQKQLKEKKQEEAEKLRTYLQGQKRMLDQQKLQKQNLLTVTKNDEARYQALLVQAQSEYAAIQTLLAGKGEMTKVREVKKGEVIGSLETGSSDSLCNSNGSHLHFYVSNKDSSGSYNPFEYLRSGIDYENCSGSSCGSSDQDPFNPSGEWEWPIEPKIRMNQGYGSTWAVRNTWVSRIYSMHNGIDIVGSNITIRAVQDGIMFRGSYPGKTLSGESCRLKYIFIEHKDGDRGTYYLHVNY